MTTAWARRVSVNSCRGEDFRVGAVALGHREPVARGRDVTYDEGRPLPSPQRGRAPRHGHLPQHRYQPPADSRMGEPHRSPPTSLRPPRRHHHPRPHRMNTLLRPPLCDLAGALSVRASTVLKSRWISFRVTVVLVSRRIDGAVPDPILVGIGQRLGQYHQYVSTQEHRYHATPHRRRGPRLAAP